MKKSKKISIISRMGGKYGLIDHIVPLVEGCVEQYGVNRYAELCGGGARILLNLPHNLFETRIYNEVDDAIVSIFRVLQDKRYLYEMITLLEKYRYSEETFLYACEELKIDRVKKHLNLVDKATYAYIATMQSRVALMHSYSPIEEYHIKYYDRIAKLKEYHHILRDVEVKNKDCIELIEEYTSDENTLIYLDPPYNPLMVRSSKIYGEYTWSVEQHRVLVEKILHSKAKIILSGYEDIVEWTYKVLEDEGWSKIKLKTVHVASSASNRHEIEYVWINFDISSYILQKISII